MKLRLNLILAVLSILIPLRLGHAQGTLQWTVNFDGPPLLQPGDVIGTTNYYEAGVTFTPLRANDEFTRAAGAVSYFPENGTPYLLFFLGDSLAGSMTRPFGLYSVDLSEFSTLYNEPRTVQFIGYHADGSTVTTDFTTDGIIDGTGPLADFQTFYFDGQFTDLVRFEVPGYRYALDNMVFTSIVPEPSVNALLLLGGSLLGYRLFRRNRAQS